METLLTTQVAAMSLGLTRGGVISAIEVGKLRATKYGVQWFVTEEAIEAYRRDHLGKRGRPRKEAQGG